MLQYTIFKYTIFRSYNCFECCSNTAAGTCNYFPPSWDVFFTQAGANLTAYDYSFAIGTGTSNFAAPIMRFTDAGYGALANNTSTASYIGKTDSLTAPASAWNPTTLPANEYIDRFPTGQTIVQEYGMSSTIYAWTWVCSYTGTTIYSCIQSNSFIFPNCPGRQFNDMATVGNFLSPSTAAVGLTVAINFTTSFATPSPTDFFNLIGNVSNCLASYAGIPSYSLNNGTPVFTTTLELLQTKSLQWLEVQCTGRLRTATQIPLVTSMLLLRVLARVSCAGRIVRLKRPAP